MAPVDGRPFLERLFDYWIAQGVSRLVVSVGYRREAITAHFGARYRDVPVDYAVEETPLGTGGGLLRAGAALGEGGPVLVLNGDTYFAVSLDALSGFHGKAGSEWTFALFRTSETGRYMGMDVAADGRIVALRSNSAAPGRLANGGVYLVERRLLREASGAPAAGPVSLEDDLLPALARRARLFGMECSGRFLDIGVPEDYRRAAQVLAS